MNRYKWTESIPDLPVPMRCNFVRGDKKPFWRWLREQLAALLPHRATVWDKDGEVETEETKVVWRPRVVPRFEQVPGQPIGPTDLGYEEATHEIGFLMKLDDSFSRPKPTAWQD